MIEKEKVLDYIKNEKILVIVRGVEEDSLSPLFNSLYDGGIRAAEIAFGDDTDEQTAGRIAALALEFGNKMLVGAGTVTDINRASLAVKAGAAFLVSPVFDEEVALFCKEQGVVYVAGAFTPTEIKRATCGGADIVKLFPASFAGADYLKAVLAPLKGTLVLAFGGITADNAPSFIKAGATGVGVGADVVNLDAIRRGDYDEITKRAQKFCKAVAQSLL